MKLRSIAVLLLLAGGLVLSPAARADDGGGDELKKKIKKQMEKILELMTKNESALLKLSSGTAARTRKIDVPVPEGEKGAGSSGAAAGSSGTAEAGHQAAEELAKLAESARSSGGQIPSELKKLVEMIPM